MPQCSGWRFAIRAMERRVRLLAQIPWTRNDGYTGSVPISHSILFFNKVASHLGATGKELVGNDEASLLLSRGAGKSNNPVLIDGREVFYSASYENASLTIFDGGHEMLTDHTAKELLRLYHN